MKESKIKGKVFLPAYIRRNTTVQQIFKAEPRRKVHNNRKSINLSEISQSLKAKAGVLRP